MIPNKAAATFPNQAKIDSVDFAIIQAGFARTGVVSGCAVTAQGSPDMTVAVAAGLIIVDGLIVTVASGNVTITTADATNPRFDLITVNNSGTKARTGGTAAANPEFPAIPANSVVLAAVYVPANDTAINTNQIVDKRVTVSPHGAILASKTSDTTVSNTTTETILATFTVPAGLLAAGDMVRTELEGTYINNSGAGMSFSFPLQFGASNIASGLIVTTTSASTGRWKADALLGVESTTAQRIGSAVHFNQPGSNAINLFFHGLYGSTTTAENTATAKAFEWRGKMSVAHANGNIIAKAGFLQIFKATG